ncbi:hypothetical protein Tco_0046821 [Tanacetum coccineum]
MHGSRGSTPCWGPAPKRVGGVEGSRGGASRGRLLLASVLGKGLQRGSGQRPDQNGDDWRGLGGDKERLWGELARLECKHDYDFCIDDDDDVKEINPYLGKKKKLILESKDYQQTLLFMDKLKVIAGQEQVSSKDLGILFYVYNMIMGVYCGLYKIIDSVESSSVWDIDVSLTINESRTKIGIRSVKPIEIQHASTTDESSKMMCKILDIITQETLSVSMGLRIDFTGTSISIGSSNVQLSESPYLHVPFIGTSQSRQHDKSESVGITIREEDSLELGSEIGRPNYKSLSIRCNLIILVDEGVSVETTGYSTNIGQNNVSQSFFVGGTLGVGEGGHGTSPELIVPGVKS